MPILNISGLDDSFFENAADKNRVSGTVSMPEGFDLRCVSGFKIRTDAPSKKYENIRLAFHGDFVGKFIAHIHGSNIDIILGSEISGAYYVKLWANSSVNIGGRTTANFLEVWVQAGNCVKIGEDCLIAHDVHLQCGDMHGIFEIASKRQVNAHRAAIEVGRHVWLGRGAKVLKNVRLGDGSICGIGSIVTRDVADFCLVAGVPAAVIREGVSWTRSAVCEDDEIRKALNFLGAA